MSRPPEPTIELVGVAKQFGAVQALRGVDLTLYSGEVHALVGENGAGKSTLVKILAGVYRPDTGSMKIDGNPIELHNPAQARHAGIAVIQQEPTLFPDLNVAENVFMGRHPRDRFGRVDWKRMYQEVEHLLARCGFQVTAQYGDFDRSPIRDESPEMIFVAEAVKEKP